MNVLDAVLERNGLDRQVKKVAEEAVELAHAALHFPEMKENFIEELADVSIMIDQMRILYARQIDEIKVRKLARLELRLRDTEGVVK